MGGKNRIVYGGRTFDQESIPSGNCYLVTSLLSDSLEINTIEFEVDSTDRSLTSFARNAPLTYFYDDAQVGIFYVQKVEREGPTRYRFYATSAMGLLDETTHYGGVYTGETVADVVKGICGSVPYSIKTNFQKIKIYGWLPIASGRENLSQVLFAVGATVKTDLDGVIRIEGLWDGISSVIDQDRMFAGASVEYSAAVTAISVTEHQYIRNGEATKLFEGVTQSGDIITFDGPMYNLSATGFSILESNANYAKVSAGSGTLTGNKYVHNTREIKKTVVPAEIPNVVSVKDATLVSLTNSEAVAGRLVNFYKHLEVIDTDTVYKSERPGDRVSIWHPYDRQAVSSCLKSVDINMSNKLRAGEKSLVGFVPPQVEDELILEHRVLLTGSGTWTVPEGTTYIRAVLIDGGASGQAGGDGTVGSRPYGDSKYAQNSKTTGPDEVISASASSQMTGTPTAGEGGKGGNGGAGGRILQATIEDVTQLTFSFKCGSAAAYGGVSETVFGTLKSSAGTRNQNGYTDPISGEVFAVAGKSGIDGGDGGSAGQAGKDAGSAIGGTGQGGVSRKGDDNDFHTSGTINESYAISATAQFGAAGGGGAGGNGENGQAPSVGATLDCGTSRGTGRATGVAISGGQGGNGKSGKAGTAYGCGGDGGSGGGGAGAGGTSSVSATMEARWYKRSSGSTVTSHNLAINVYAVAQPPAASIAGTGGAGGAGKAGCIILYYGTRKVKDSGPVVTKDGRSFVEVKGRRFTV